MLPLAGQCGSYSYNYNENCKDAYRSYLALQLPAGNKAILREIKSDPYNLLATYIADYEDFMLLVFNGNESELKQRRGHYEERMDLLDKGDDSSPWYRLCKAGVCLHWAVIHGRFGENFKAALAFRRSFQLLKENRQKFPSFAQNEVFLGLEEAVVGTIPEDYKWIASVFGFKGNVKNGVSKIAAFITNHPAPDELFREEAIVYNCYLKFYLLSQADAVWNFINNNGQFPIQNNLMRAFIKTNIAINYRKAETAIQTLHIVQILPEYSNFPVMDYEMGNALLLKLDFSGITYLQHYTDRNTGKLYTKDSWQKMAFGWYLQQNMTKAAYCMQQIKKQGNQMVDADKQAQRFAESGTWPNAGLLQARLLTDGGYYQQALAKLSSKKETDFNTSDRLEFLFRTGRIYDELNDDTKALQYYQAAINAGKDRPEQYAARAALQAGLIYERRGSKAEAISYYRQCLSMRHHDFQSSLDQQSKAGINRLSGSL
ncbi:tetratricopeptide repeat protein [Chitinophagaceae bacterium MMS25-I14]